MSENLSIAEDINTKAEQLRELAKTGDEKVLAAIARNPNTPSELLVELAGEYLDEIGNNPALELILFENPNFIEDISYKHFEDFLYKHEKCCSIWLPDWFFKLAVFHSNYEIRSLIASNFHTPVSYLGKLAKDEHEYVRSGVADNENTPSFLLEKLAEDEDSDVRERVGFNENTPISLLEKLAEDESFWVRYSVAYNKNTPINLLEKLVTDPHPAVRSTVAENQNTPISLLEKLTEDEDDEVRKAVAENPKMKNN